MFDTLLENGYMVFDLSTQKPLLQAKEMLERKLSEICEKKLKLEEYHCEDDKRHTEIQITMTQFLREQRLTQNILRAEQTFFEKLFGPDLLIQINPYLRIARPHKPGDNIGYHRDTFYGGTPYELSILIPFVDMPPLSALKVIPGSHKHAEKTYFFKQIVDPEVTKGSPKHGLGFLYAPKVMDDAEIEKKMVPIPLKLGQGLIFCLTTVHGSRANLGTFPRWSSDTRLMHAFAPVDPTRFAFYQPYSSSVVTQTALDYLKANT